MILSMCLLPMSFLLHNLKPISGLAKEYANLNIRFYQLFHLTADLGLSHVICATKRLAPPAWEGSLRYAPVVAPTSRGTQTSTVISSERVTEDQFVVPDDWSSGEEDDDSNFASTNFASPYSIISRRQQNSLSATLDARSLYRLAYIESGTEGAFASDNTL